VHHCSCICELFQRGPDEMLTVVGVQSLPGSSSDAKKVIENELGCTELARGTLPFNVFNEVRLLPESQNESYKIPSNSCYNISLKSYIY